VIPSSTDCEPNVYIHETATVGEGCKIGANAWIGPDVRIGDGCEIGPGAVIGSIGFGYERDKDGNWLRKPHKFGVEIGPDVHVGANAVINRGSWRTTTVGRGSRLDALVFLAHNVVLGQCVMVVAHAELSGSVNVGDGAWIGPRACVLQRLTIGPRALVAAGAVVLRDVRPNVTVAGVPARVIDAKQGVRDKM
jgi:UDP-3-O-[3-hydroxymyristoyl] glucosamine N-acyltransferase